MKFNFLRPYTHQQRPINPKIRQRWPILPFEKNHFVQGPPPRKFHILINIAPSLCR